MNLRKYPGRSLIYLWKWRLSVRQTSDLEYKPVSWILPRFDKLLRPLLGQDHQSLFHMLGRVAEGDPERFAEGATKGPT